MQVSGSQLDAASLAAYGAEALQLLAHGHVSTLAERFGYALAFDEDPASVIQRDLALSLASVGATCLAPADVQATRVGYFEPNDTGLFALIQVQAPTNNGRVILVELVVTGNKYGEYLTLEQISDVI